MTDTSTTKRPVVLAIWLILAGVIGWGAAFKLTLEKFDSYIHPGQAASCDFNIVVTCSKNLESAQGSLFGFPNPLIGVASWIAVIVVGVALLAGATFPRWFWIVFNVGIVAAFALVVFLISQSIFVLGTLCIYCMITWVVTIPTFFAVTLRNLRTYGRGGLARFAGAASGWVPVIALVCFVIIAIMAQVQLDVTRYIF